MIELQIHDSWLQIDHLYVLMEEAVLIIDL